MGVKQKLLAQPSKFSKKSNKMRMKVALISLTSMVAISLGAPVPDADPEAFLNLGAVAIPAITGSALIDGLLLGKVAFLKAAILANLLLGSNSADELADDASYVAPQDDYGVPYEPPVNSYGAPAVSYEEPAPSYDAPAPSYDAPEPAAPAYAPPTLVDTYGSPAADPLPSYQPTRY